MANQTGHPPPELQGVFLDFYGTVVGGDRQAVESVCQAVIDAYRLDLRSGDLARTWGHAYFVAIGALNGHGFRTLTEIERDTLIETIAPLVGRVDVTPFMEILNDYLVAPPQFEEVREVLAKVRLPICIVSNADDRELRSAIRHVGLKFEHVVSSEQARSYKPDSGIFQYALETTGWSADRVVHIGDSLHSDVGGAQPLGLRTVWVCREGRIGDIGTASPDETWPDLRPIVELTLY